jgi:hypothetical protein
MTKKKTGCSKYKHGSKPYMKCIRQKRGKGRRAKRVYMPEMPSMTE